jgi:hypothetical protein
MKFSAIRAERLSGLVGQAVFGGVIVLTNQRPTPIFRRGE